MTLSIQLDRILPLAVLLVLGASIRPSPAAVLAVPAQHPTIQGAIDAAVSGDTVAIAPGLYEEHLLITRKNLTLSGAPGATLRATENMPAILGYGTVFMIGIDQCTNVVLRGLTFDGDRLGEAYRGTGFGGVVYHGSGGRVENCVFHGFRYRDAMDGGFGWTGLSAINEVASRAVDIEVSGCRFFDNGSGIHLRGNVLALTQTRLTFVLRDNLIEGIGPTTLGAQVGVLISYGASGTVLRNRITDHNHLDPGPVRSFGILALDWHYMVGFRNDARNLLPVQFDDNTLVANQWGIASIRGSGSSFTGNFIQGVHPQSSFGIGVSGATNRITGNSFSDVTRGVLMIGTDPDYGNALGHAVDAQLADNRFCGVTTNVFTEPLVTGVVETGSLTCPFEPAALQIQPAVILSLPSHQRGWILEAAPQATGPWTALDAVFSQAGNVSSTTLGVTRDASVFRLRQP